MKKGFTVKEKRWPAVRETVLAAAALEGYLLFELINVGSGFSLWRVAANALPVYIFVRILYLVTNSLKGTVLCSGILCFLASTANYYVYLFRGRPILPWDLDSMGTAASVMGGYTYEPTWQMVCAFFLLICCSAAVFWLRPEHRHARSIRTFVANLAVAAGTALLYGVLLYPRLTDSLWDMGSVYENEGVVAGFLSHCKYAGYRKPKKYSEQRRQEVLDRVVPEKAKEGKVSAKNIIVVMNESFTDFRVIGDHSLGDAYMPYVDSLSDNALRGTLYVSVYGAGTSNTEFEALTGASCAYVPAVPYQTVIDRDVDSLATVLKEEGFYTEAFHPYLAANWNRDRVYPYMGFDRFRSMADMDVGEEDMLRWCVSDYSDYREIIRSYEEHEGERFFLFNVTMQNHGGYADLFENFTNTVDLSAYGDFAEAEAYLTLVQESDRQLKGLIDYFSEQDEPTLICFFGDHQPCLEDGFLETLYGKPLDELTLEEKHQQFMVPLVLWSNYGLEEVELDRISANYLPALILKEANLPMPAYESFLWQLYQEYPVIAGIGIWDKEGNYYRSLEDVGADALTEYGWLQYGRLKKKQAVKR